MTPRAGAIFNQLCKYQERKQTSENEGLRLKILKPATEIEIHLVTTKDTLFV